MVFGNNLGTVTPLLTSAMRHQNVCFYIIYIINPFVERPLVSASGLSTKISGLSMKITHCSTKISSLSTKITSLSMKIPSIGTIAWPPKKYTEKII